MSEDDDGIGSDDGDKDDDDAVGYGKPPKQRQFKPGESGNPAGRPKKAESDPIDISEVLNESVLTKSAGVVRLRSPFDVGVRKLVSRAVADKNLGAMLEFIRLCERYEILVPEPAPKIGGVLIVPKTWDWVEWGEMLETHGPPPWPGERSGLLEDIPSSTDDE